MTPVHNFTFTVNVRLKQKAVLQIQIRVNPTNRIRIQLLEYTVNYLHKVYRKHWEKKKHFHGRLFLKVIKTCCLNFSLFRIGIRVPSRYELNQFRSAELYKNVFYFALIWADMINQILKAPIRIWIWWVLYVFSIKTTCSSSEVSSEKLLNQISGSVRILLLRVKIIIKFV